MENINIEEFNMGGVWFKVHFKNKKIIAIEENTSRYSKFLKPIIGESYEELFTISVLCYAQDGNKEELKEINKFIEEYGILINFILFLIQ